ncbi:DUF3124 domain-containing protein [Oceanispirochaeta crateris]|nr:DUF3124 domain-containing protein [Oceanispirochaeta crateris]
MRKLSILLLLSVLTSCNPELMENVARKISWESRQFQESENQELIHGQSYLPVYSHIYYVQDNSPFYLTATISIRNTSTEDPFYLFSADYYNTDGEIVKKYLANPIYVNPLETIEFVISESDTHGGSGANFIFDWAVENPGQVPLFEAVMISTRGQQGLSFSTRGVQNF